MFQERYFRKDTYNSDVESLINYNSSTEKIESRYHPTSNTIIDQGVQL